MKELAGRAGARLLSAWAVCGSQHTALRALLRIPLPRPRVIGVDDVALRRRHRYATVVIDAETHERIEGLADRNSETLEAWMRAHPGIETVCRDGSASYAEAIRRALPEATQVSDRWHLWHGLARAASSTAPAGSTWRARARPAAPPAPVPGLPGRTLPRPPAPTPCRGGTPPWSAG